MKRTPTIPTSTARRPGAIFERGARFIDRVVSLSTLAGGPIGAARLVLGIRAKPEAVHIANYRGKPVAFRAPDEEALREVLVNAEYNFLAGRLGRTERASVLDIGAHIGTFSMWIAGEAPEAALTCVEADPETFVLTQRNLATHAPNARCLHRAASATDGEILRFSNSGPSMSHRIDGTGDVEVEGISLASLVDLAAGTSGSVNIAKIDIEGSEERLIAGHPEALAKIDALVIELHPALCDTVRVREILAATFDRIVEIGGRKSSKPLLLCERTTTGMSRR